MKELLHLQIYKSNDSNDIGSGVVVGTLPAGFRPSVNRIVPAWAGSDTAGWIKNAANLNIKLVRRYHL